MRRIAEAALEDLVLEALAACGWTIAYGPDLAPGEPLGERADYRTAVLLPRVEATLRRLNPGLPDEAYVQALNGLLRAESAVALTENWRAYVLMTQGVPVEYRDQGGDSRVARLRVVDWEDIAANDFLAVNQFTIVGKSERRPDVLLFVNGLPFVLIELKRPGEANATLKGAFNQIRTYVSQIPDLFTWNQVTVISAGVQARAGTFTTPWEHYSPWKTIDGQNLAPDEQPQYEVLVRGLLNPTVLLDLIRHFTVFSDERTGLVKKTSKYHQYWAVQKAITCTVEAATSNDPEKRGRAGVVWHTQGSGKSQEMHTYAGKIATNPAMENPTVVVLTDRNDLDDQLFAEVFATSRAGAPLPEVPVQADSRDHLRVLLDQRASGGIIFSTIQKFGLSKDDRDAGRSFPELSARRNIVVMVDEAHRSNYDFIDGFARHLRDALPNAVYIGFTGTPIESADKSTRRVFGDYIDVYDLTQAVEDGATVKVFYEARLAKVDLPREAIDAIDDEFADAVSGQESDAQERLKSRWAKVEAIVGSEKRVKELAHDIVEHWEARQQAFTGKAMIVAMSRRIAVALYDEIVALRPEWHSDDDDLGKIKVVITGSAADDETLQPHIRNKERRAALKARAKNPSDTLELVIVRDMWLTGFDSPSMCTMYVDKPMRGAPLMQAIARVNRTFKDKPGGLIVDYIGIADDLKRALADYTHRDQENQDLGQDIHERAIPGLIEKHEIVGNILHGFNWRERLADGSPKAFIQALTATFEYLINRHPGPADSPCTKDTPCLKCRFMDQTRRLVSLFALCVPAPEAIAIRDDVAFFDAVRAEISKAEGSDRQGGDPNAEVDTAIKQILSEAMAGSGVIDIYAEAGLAKPDISLIDDEFLKAFPNNPNPGLTIEMLKRLLGDEIRRIGTKNVVAGKRFSEMLQDSILRYQNRTLDSAQIVAELAALAAHLREQKHRGELIGLTDDELAFYDAIASNDAALRELGDETLRKIAHELVDIVRRDAKTDWNVKEQVRAKLRTTIKRLLRKYGYPPDQQEKATDLVLQQAEVLASEGLDAE